MGTSAQRPIKVMHIIARMNVGGPAIEIDSLMRHIDPALVEQQLVTGYCGEDEADYLETRATDIRATRIEGLGRSVSPLQDAQAFARLRHLIRVCRPDVVHTHTAKAGVTGRMAAKFAATGAKVVHTYHGHLLSGYFGPLGAAVYSRTERFLAGFTDAFVAVGPTVRDDLVRARIGQSDDYRVVRTGVELDALPDRAWARSRLGLTEEESVVSFIGRLTAIKRPDRILELARDVNLQANHPRFIMVGDGDLRMDLQRTAESEDLPVSFLGWRTDIETILAATDVVLLTSDSEGVPLCLLEAAAAGVPAVATRVGDVGEAVIDGYSGILCDTDIADLRVALGRLLRDRAYRLQLGKGARQHHLNSIGGREFVQHHVDLYRDLVK